MEPSGAQTPWCITKRSSRTVFYELVIVTARSTN